MDFEDLAHPTGIEFLPQIAAPISIRQLPLMSAANAAKAGYNSLILLSGAPEGIRIPAPNRSTHYDPANCR
jgi:hypothetical protein